MQKVPRRKQFPYAEENYEFPEWFDEHMLAEKDYDTVKSIVKSGDRSKLRDFINKRLTTSENISSTPGLATRDYLSALTGESVKRRYPEIKKAALEETPADLGKAVRSKLFPNIEKALGAFKLSSDVKMGNRDTTSPEGVITLSGRQIPSGDIGTAIHENAHLLDFLAKKYSKEKAIAKAEGREIAPEKEKVIREFLKSKPASAPLFEEDPEDDKKFEKYTTLTEKENKYGKKLDNPEIPNFGDYDFEKGEFRSDMIRDPLDVQEESGKPHHLDRNQTYENMIKALEDEGKLDRLTKENNFKKLRSIIS